MSFETALAKPMPSEYIPAALRRQVRARARGLCEYCRCSAFFTTASLSSLSKPSRHPTDSPQPVNAGTPRTEGVDFLFGSDKICNGIR